SPCVSSRRRWPDAGTRPPRDSRPLAPPGHRGVDRRRLSSSPPGREGVRDADLTPPDTGEDRRDAALTLHGHGPDCWRPARGRVSCFLALRKEGHAVARKNIVPPRDTVNNGATDFPFGANVEADDQAAGPEQSAPPDVNPTDFERPSATAPAPGPDP